MTGDEDCNYVCPFCNNAGCEWCDEEVAKEKRMTTTKEKRLTRAQRTIAYRFIPVLMGSHVHVTVRIGTMGATLATSGKLIMGLSEWVWLSALLDGNDGEFHRIIIDPVGAPDLSQS